jgi:hypothetical protein
MYCEFCVKICPTVDMDATAWLEAMEDLALGEVFCE